MSKKSTQPNTLFWVIAIIALIWNAFGVLSYLGQAYLTDETKATLSDAQLEMIQNRPAWATAAFAIAVFAGALASLLLLLKKRWAYPLFVLSLIGILVQMVHDVFMTGAMEDAGVGEIALAILIPAVGIFLMWYSKGAKHNGWLS